LKRSSRLYEHGNSTRVGDDNDEVKLTDKVKAYGQREIKSTPTRNPFRTPRERKGIARDIPKHTKLLINMVAGTLEDTQAFGM